MAAKTPLTDKEKIDKFMQWLKSERKGANDSALGSGSSWNHAYSGAFDDVYNKARKVFIEPKIKK